MCFRILASSMAGPGAFWKEGNFHFVYKEGLVFFGCPIHLLGRKFEVPRII